MAYNEMFFAHGPCGFAVCIGKTHIGEWGIPPGSADAMQRLTRFLATTDDIEIRHRYYDTQVDPGDSEIESFLILTGNTFRTLWTTPSGKLFNWRDLVDPASTEWASVPEDARRNALPKFSCQNEVDLEGIFQIELLPMALGRVTIGPDSGGLRLKDVVIK